MEGEMATPKIFIDGEHGTTGLKIRDRLGKRGDLDLLSLPHSERRNPEARAALLNDADLVMLCLPDDASREAVKMLEDAGRETTRVIDASTAFRSDPEWVFGFAEMEPGNREKIAKARFVSNPGCYSTGAIALLRPLVIAGTLPTDYPVTINAVSGYTGGGRNLIAQMENPDAEDHIASNHFLYALTLKHKHVPEIVSRAGLTRDPIFTPNVGRFAQGMLVNVPLHVGLLNDATLASIHHILEEHYQGQDVVEVVRLKEVAGHVRLDPEEMRDTDRMKLYVCGTAGTGMVNLVASLDNLGKGASGAAVQNMDIMLKG